MPQKYANVDYSLLDRITNQLVCSRCFQYGILSPVTQVLSRHHRPRTLCRECSPPRPAAAPTPIYRLNG